MTMVCCLVSLLGSTLGVVGSSQPATEYLSDLLHRFIVFRQGWGQLGVDTCAHAPGQTPLPLRIGETTYPKGLGHHAPGEIVIDLNGEYVLFEAEVGVQWQQGTTGSVVFQVYVDGKKRFDSGVMREIDPPKPVRLRVEDAGELRLVVTDAGDGITCDCANWADARLTRSTKPKSAPSETIKVDVAPFAQVVTSDPQRIEGCRAGRTGEYLAEDIFLEDPLTPDADGVYTVPIIPERGGSIGLHWLERRRLTELYLQFASTPPLPEAVQLQVWIGESHWQGKWVPVTASVACAGHEWLFRPDWREVAGTAYGVRKVRWVFAPSAGAVRIRAFHAYTSSRWDEVELTLRLQSPQEAIIHLYNGEIVNGNSRGHTVQWDERTPLRLRVRYSRPLSTKPDRTVLQVRLSDAAFGVAVDDVLAHDTVYVPHAGLLVSRAPNLTIEEYQRSIARRKTILERVRNMPEQTFAQAMQKTHHKVQNNGPIMLSLVCDNRKFIVEQDGTLHRDEIQLRPLFANGRARWVERHLHGGWFPISVITWREGDVVYRQTTFVAPLDEKPISGSNGWLYEHAACIAHIDAENLSAQPATTQVSLAVKPQAEMRPVPDGYAIAHNGNITAVVNLKEADWGASAQGDALSLSAVLPPQAKRHLVLVLPAWQTAEPFAMPDVPSALTRAERYWQETLKDAVQIDIPDPTLLNMVRAAQVHCLLAARNEEDGKRVAAWIASMAYGPLESEAHSVIRGMLLMGHREFARRALEYFVKRYQPAGFLTTGYTLMGTGWHLWTLCEYYALTRDGEWIRQIAPAVENVCRWIVRQREKTMRRMPQGDPVPEYGLMPPGVMADWNAYAYYFALNGYYCAGLRHAASALVDANSTGAYELLQEAQRFEKDVLRAYRNTQAQMPVVPLQNGTWIPGSPSQVHCPAPTAHFFPGEDGNRSWAYDVELGAHQLIPQGVIPAHSPEADWMIDYLEDVAFLESGWFDYPADENRRDWFNLGGFSKVQPYYTRNPEIYAMRLDAKPFIRSYFNMLASLLNEETLWLWEHFHNVGAWNKTHETGYFLQQTRFMLAMEHGNALHLAPLIPRYWLKAGNTVAVENLPTRFGTVSYRIRSQVAQKMMEAEVTLPATSPPFTVCVHLRHPDGKSIRKVLVNGREHRDFNGECVLFGGEAGRTMTLQAWF